MRESIKEKLYKYCYQDVINQYNQLSGNEIISCKPYQILAYIHLGDYEFASSLIEDATNMISESKHAKIYAFQIKVCKVVELYRTGKYKEMKPFLVDAHKLYNQFDIAEASEVVDFFVFMRNYEIYLPNNKPIMDSIEILEDNLSISKNAGFEMLSSMSLHNLCVMLVAIGELERARSLAFTIVESFNPDSPPQIGSYFYFGLLGRIEFYLGNQKSCIEYFEQSLRMTEFFDDLLLRTTAYSLLVIALSEFDQRTESKKYLEELHTFIENKTDKSFLYTSLEGLARAIFLKSSKRINSIAESQTILESLVQSTMSDFGQFDSVLQNIILTTSLELLIEEYRLLKNEDILNEILDLVNNLEELAEYNQSINLKIHALIFNSKLDLLKDKFETSMQTLEKALDLSEFHKLGKLTIHIRNEIEFVKENRERWVSMLEKGSSIEPEIELKNYKEYLSEVSRVVFDYQNSTDQKIK